MLLVDLCPQVNCNNTIKNILPEHLRWVLTYTPDNNQYYWINFYCPSFI